MTCKASDKTASSAGNQGLLRMFLILGGPVTSALDLELSTIGSFIEEMAVAEAANKAGSVVGSRGSMSGAISMVA
ncbi:hypothetical protein WICPIJ_004627 [Wickerhamomyces pijperi]|uniref:Uncharacterized protein n=1 Tax=Wickerhamomyces pijperi TaxID=599730 RepID=A0A9P8Q7B7_WICPI|nr:hypothetical protein WICPIJ_004627 [Wickerhamomyces pijperi]